jgi:ABC-2 type transport system ATP-binding protein
VREGEILGFLGPNGAGKTTTIQMLLGLLEPTRGSIAMFGKKFSQNREAILKQVNFSSAYLTLPHNLTIQEALTVFGLLYEVPNLKKTINEVLEIFELKDFRKKLCGKLSSGQAARLNLAKAFINHPRIVFLDEPTASLDPVVAAKIRKLLLDFHKREKLTIFYTSHNMREVEQLSDRIIFIDKGMIVAQGTADQIKSRVKQRDLEHAFIKLAENHDEP